VGNAWSNCLTELQLPVNREMDIGGWRIGWHLVQTASLKAVAFLPLLPDGHSGLKNRQTPIASIDSISSMNSIS
jgi:hypothetical protein